MNRKERRRKNLKTGRTATLADVNRAKREASSLAVEACWAMFFSVLRDKEGYSVEDLQRVWSEIRYTADSVEKGYINVTDLAHALKTEAGIVLE